MSVTIKAEDISKAFVIKDNNGNTVVPRLVTPQDSALFYIDVPAGSNGSFWQANKMEQYDLCFANISNLQWYAERKPCGNGCGGGASSTVSIVSPVLYPNPSHGIYNCLQDKGVIVADEISIINAQGVQVGSFKNEKQFNISHLAAGVYWYRLASHGNIFTGKLVKL